MIHLIQKRPGMFLGSNSISALWHFLDGYQAAEREHAVCQTGELFPLPFLFMHEYTGYRLRDHNNMGWCHQILNSCDGAEDVALQKFFEFYDGFIRVRMKRYWRAALTEDNIACNNQMKRACSCSVRPGYTGFGLYKVGDMTVREPIYRNPLAAYVIELTIPVCILAVETATNVKLERWFFSSPEKAKKGAESYFDPIDSWEEFTAHNISFDKNIVF